MKRKRLMFLKSLLVTIIAIAQAAEQDDILDFATIALDEIEIELASKTGGTPFDTITYGPCERR